MKRLYYLLFFVSVGMAFQGCVDEPMEKEQYKKQIYLVGIAQEGGMIIRDIDFAHLQGETFVSVATSGTLSPDSDVPFSIEEFDEVIDTYNSKFRSAADVQYRKLDAQYYSLTMDGVIRAGDSYARLPLSVFPEGLHCDSLYAIPLRMKSSVFPFPDNNPPILVRIRTMNEYSGSYTYMGMTTNLNTQAVSAFNLTRNAVAVSSHTIRIQHQEVEDLSRIDAFGIVIQIASNNMLSFESWKDMQIVSGHGTYDPIKLSFSFEFEYINSDGVSFKTEATLVSSKAL